jgi:hypothetical protein
MDLCFLNSREIVGLINPSIPCVCPRFPGIIPRILSSPFRHRMYRGGSDGGHGRSSPDKGIRVGSGHSSPSRYSLARTPPRISVSLTRTKRNALHGNSVVRRRGSEKMQMQSVRRRTNDDVSIFELRIADITRVKKIYD